MQQSKAMFTIALPVRNGGEYLKECIASVLAQECKEFNLVVLENCSTDGTAEWLQTVSDPRVSVVPAEKPLAIQENWKRILQIPKSEFLTTIGHDDILDPNFLCIIKGLIKSYPDAGLYLTHFRLINETGGGTGHCRPMPSRETAAEYLASRLCGLRDSFGTGHVLRSATYEKLGGIPAYPKLLSADDALFLSAMEGTYRATALEEAFSYRYYTGSTGGGSSRADMFEAIEIYANFLAELQERDPDVKEVLHRYFGNYAMEAAAAWKNEAILRFSPADGKLFEEIEDRSKKLAHRFGTPGVPMQGLAPRALLLRKAMHSSFHRKLYRGWNGWNTLWGSFCRFTASLLKSRK